MTPLAMRIRERLPGQKMPHQLRVWPRNGRSGRTDSPRRNESARQAIFVGRFQLPIRASNGLANVSEGKDAEHPPNLRCGSQIELRHLDAYREFIVFRYVSVRRVGRYQLPVLSLPPLS